MFSLLTTNKACDNGYDERSKWGGRGDVVARNRQLYECLWNGVWHSK